MICCYGFNLGRSVLWAMCLFILGCVLSSRIWRLCRFRVCVVLRFVGLVLTITILVGPDVGVTSLGRYLWCYLLFTAGPRAYWTGRFSGLAVM